MPGNRFEVLECRAALEAAEAGEQDAVLSRAGGLDVLAQHILGMACQAPFDPDALFAEVRSALPYAGLEREHLRPRRRFRLDRRLRAQSLRALRQAEAGGRRPVARRQSARRPAIPLERRHHRRHADDQSAPRLRAQAAACQERAPGGRVLGEVEEYFVEQLPPGATFVFAGEVLRFEGLRETEAFVSRARAETR